MAEVRDLSSDVSRILVPTTEGNDLENVMSIAVISTADLALSLKEALLEYHKSKGQQYKLYVHVSEEVKPELVDRTLHVDYIIILADPRRGNVVQKVKHDLSRVSSVFLATSRCVVAVSWPEGALPHMVATCSGSLHQVCRDNMLHKLVQPEEGPDGKMHLVDRLLRLARSARGLNATRVPNITGSFNPGPHWQQELVAAVAAMLLSGGGDEDDDEDADDDDEKEEEEKEEDKEEEDDKNPKDI